MKRSAFTLIELLVVVSVVALLISMIAPALQAARQQAKGVICQSNLHQLAIANANYAVANHDHYVAGAPDMWAPGGGRHRWHGVRPKDGGSRTDPNANRYDPKKSPLVDSLAAGRIKSCPSFVDFNTDPARNAFAAGGGGYGYNLAYIGTQSNLWDLQPPPYPYNYLERVYAAGVHSERVANPAGTAMFADTAMPHADRRSGESWLNEYDFAETPYLARGSWMDARTTLTPSIHFRHRGRANVVWVDGHTSAEAMSGTRPGRNIYGASSEEWGVGWFGPLDNRAFDLHDEGVLDGVGG